MRNLGTTTSRLLTSVGHPIDRNTGHRVGGGPFYVTHTGPYYELGHVDNVVESRQEQMYSGPVYGLQVGDPSIEAYFRSKPSDSMNEGSMNSDGATAIAQCAPVNPTANLGTSLAESFREGVPSLPGIQSWERRTRALKNLGSEYLNYQFGWAPLQNEVHSVVNAARHHRDIMQNYRHNEGRDVHRSFHFTPEITTHEVETTPGNAFLPLFVGSSGFIEGSSSFGAATRLIRCTNVRKRWFEGCFTYGGPSKLDNFGRHIGYGSEADAVFGLRLTPSVLWELTPWSWAVDWFTNAGDVITNITNFANAGLVMRYGYMMEETISTYYTHYGESLWRIRNPSGPYKTKWMGGCSIGSRTVTKSRCPANPFGFGIGWEGLSPTQLAITAALGITRALK